MRVVVKALVLFFLLNILFALLNPMGWIGRVSIYNWLVPGRARLPYGENDAAYNLSTNNLEAMFASHVIAQPKPADEYRVVLIGDSATWGILLRPEETLAGVLNTEAYQLTDGRQVHTYNLGHPILSLTKDLLLLDEAMSHDPDMIIWLVTLQSFPPEKQTLPPLVQANTERIHKLSEQFGLVLADSVERPAEQDFLDRTIVGQRRELADWVRLQAFGMMWGITGLDQLYPDDYTQRRNDFDEDMSWQNYDEPATLSLAVDVIAAGHARVGDVPLLLINEPIFIGDGENSDLRYNFWYPRWAYDAYREQLASEAEVNGWWYVDLWDVIESTEFTDSPVHLTPIGSRQLGQLVSELIVGTEG